jgi:phosphoribosylformylglycinamidine (FGAM) synthase-like amidotransferase family enzyme
MAEEGHRAAASVRHDNCTKRLHFDECPVLVFPGGFRYTAKTIVFPN